MSFTATETAPVNAAASAIAQLIDPWIKACIARDWDGLLQLCTDDVAFCPPNEPVIEGAAVRPWLEAFPTIKAMAWDIDHLESAGDLACLRGWVTNTLVIGGETIVFNGKYTDVARKGPDGNWRFALVMWSSNEPIPGNPA